MSAADLLQHPLMIALFVFTLGQGAALVAVFWRLSTAVSLGSQTDEHLRAAIIQNRERIERLEDEHFSGGKKK